MGILTRIKKSCIRKRLRKECLDWYSSLFGCNSRFVKSNFFFDVSPPSEEYNRYLYNSRLTEKLDEVISRLAKERGLTFENVKSELERFLESCEMKTIIETGLEDYETTEMGDTPPHRYRQEFTQAFCIPYIPKK